MEWIKVRIKGSGQVIEMAPLAAQARIASGTAEQVLADGGFVPSQPPAIVGRPTIEAAVLQPPQECAVIGTVKFHVGPRSPRPRA